MQTQSTSNVENLVSSTLCLGHNHNHLLEILRFAYINCVLFSRLIIDPNTIMHIYRMVFIILLHEIVSGKWFQD